MPLKIGVKELVQRAESEIDSIAAEDAIAAAGYDNVLFIDLRDVRELEREGKIPGAKHVPRGMLEFWIDPESPYHKTYFQEKLRFIFYCNLGWRSALATQSAQTMGLENVCHIRGGFEAWKAAGGTIQDLGKK